MIKIILDPGHGDPDPGALGSMSREADINLSVALTAQKYLKTFGYIPILTRDTAERIIKDNRTVDLSARANVANRINGNCFICKGRGGIGCKTGDRYCLRGDCTGQGHWGNGEN